MKSKSVKSNSKESILLIKRLCLAVLFIFAFPAGLAYQVGTGFEQTAMTPDFFNSIIDQLEMDSIRERILEAAGARLESELLWDQSLVNKALNLTLEDQWLREQALSAADQFLKFIKNDQESLEIKIDIRDRWIIFRDVAEVELTEKFPGIFDVIDDSYYDDIINRLGLPSELTLVNIQGPDDLEPESRNALKRLGKSRTGLSDMPLIVLASLTLIVLLWFGLAVTLKLIGTSMIFSGASFFLLWRVMWNVYVLGFTDNLAETYQGSAAVLSLVSEKAFQITAVILDRIAFITLGGGLVLLLLGLIAWIVINKMKNESVRHGKVDRKNHLI